MTIIQGTGCMPIALSSIEGYSDSKAIDKRSVMLDVYRAADGWYYLLEASSDWDGEAPNAFASGPCKDVGEVACEVEEYAMLIIPDYWGYPATPEYVGRQAKLRGQLQHAVSICLTNVLRQIFEASNPPDSQTP